MSAEAAKEWLRRADADLEVALACSNVDADNACYHLQQAIERAVKAAITFDDLYIPHMHDLEDLVGRLPSSWGVGGTRLDWGRISSWVVARYPGSGVSPTDGDVTYGINAANEVIDLVRASMDARS